jgi:hypothetical protein
MITLGALSFHVLQCICAALRLCRAAPPSARRALRPQACGLAQPIMRAGVSRSIARRSATAPRTSAVGMNFVQGNACTHTHIHTQSA